MSAPSPVPSRTPRSCCPRRPATTRATRRAWPAPTPDFSRRGDLRGLKVGVPRNHYFDRVSPEVEEAVRGAIERLAELGAELVDVEIPMARYIQATQWGLMVPEATAYHERSLRAIGRSVRAGRPHPAGGRRTHVGGRLPPRPAGPHA